MGHRPEAGNAVASYDSDAAPALLAFRDRVFADEAAAAELGALFAPEVFAVRVESLAAAWAIALPRQTVLELLSQRQTMPPLQGWPPRAWLPVRVWPSAGGTFAVEWAWFGREPLAQPFFGQDAQRQSALPMNRLIPVRTALDDLAQPAGALHEPDGFIFHQSRCGSTLVARALATLAGTSVISEAPPLDAIVELGVYRPELTVERHAQLLRAMVAALTRPRRDETRTFIKLDSWHTLALPLFRRAFPATPWIFLYRDPVEILVSQLRLRGLQTVPGAIPTMLYGIPPDLPQEEYCAMALARIAEAARSDHAGDHGALVNYAQLPEALFETILPHFGVAPDTDARAAIAGVLRVNAKQPEQPFAADSGEKRSAAGAAVAAAAAAHMQPVYEALETMRLKGSAPSA